MFGALAVLITSVTLALVPHGTHGVRGTVTLTRISADATRVTVVLRVRDARVRPVHIHGGRCGSFFGLPFGMWSPARRTRHARRAHAARRAPERQLRDRRARRAGVLGLGHLRETWATAQAGSDATPSRSTTSPSRSSETSASPSVGCSPAATARSATARRCRNEPSNLDCLRDGS